MLRVLGDVGVEVVLEHTERRFGEPALARSIRSTRRAHDPVGIEAGIVGQRIGGGHDKPPKGQCKPGQATDGISSSGVELAMAEQLSRSGAAISYG
jgi:hypothetical protein